MCQNCNTRYLSSRALTKRTCAISLLRHIQNGLPAHDGRHPEGDGRQSGCSLGRGRLPPPHQRREHSGQRCPLLSIPGDVRRGRNLHGPNGVCFAPPAAKSQQAGPGPAVGEGPEPGPFVSRPFSRADVKGRDDVWRHPDDEGNSKRLAMRTTPQRIIAGTTPSRFSITHPPRASSVDQAL